VKIRDDFHNNAHTSEAEGRASVASHPKTEPKGVNMGGVDSSRRFLCFANPMNVGNYRLARQGHVAFYEMPGMSGLQVNNAIAIEPSVTNRKGPAYQSKTPRGRKLLQIVV